MFCLHILPLARPVQAKVQMLTTSSGIVKSIPWILVNLSHLYFDPPPRLTYMISTVGHQRFIEFQCVNGSMKYYFSVLWKYSGSKSVTLPCYLTPNVIYNGGPYICILVLFIAFHNNYTDKLGSQVPKILSSLFKNAERRCTSWNL